MNDVDVAIVGAGHNSLVCAAYLARAGYRVCVLERRAVAGGAAATEELIPGYRFDLGGLTHILTAYTPIMHDLALERYGLSYITLDPFLFAPFPDGSHIMLWRDLDRACASIAAVSPADAERYRAFVREWQPIARALVESLLQAPAPLNIARGFGWEVGRRLTPSRLAALLRSYGGLIESRFAHPHVRAMLTWLTAQAGPPPGAPAQAILAAVNALYHDRGHMHARGGSGALTDALVRMICDQGGSVRTRMPVSRIVVRGGRAVGVETQAGDVVSARAVVAGTHITTTFALLGENTPTWARRQVARARVGNGLGMLVGYALSELPDYAALPGTPGPQHHAMQYICPDVASLRRAYAQFQRGRPATEPALAALTFSALDPTLAPPGRHVLYLWGQYYPHTLASGSSWDLCEEEAADHMLETLAVYAPNLRRAILGRVIMSPAFMERELGLARANTMHLDMGFGQLFGFRPALGLGAYRGPVRNMYLTGASTHPGGGVSGAPGRNTAAALLHDFATRRLP